MFIKVAQRKANGRDAFQGPFDCGGHGARVNDIDGAVAAMVDSAQQDVRFAVQNFVDRQLDTIHWGARSSIRLDVGGTKLMWPHFQNVADGDGMSHPTLVAVWRHDHDISQVGDAFHQVADARRGDAVVIGDENEGAFGGSLGHVQSGLRRAVKNFEEIPPKLLNGADLNTFVGAVGTADVGAK